MNLIADILLVIGALGAGFYCLILAKKINRLNDLENGVGGAVAVLSTQVDDLNKSLKTAQTTSAGSNQALTELTNRAESVSARLELLMASLHDVPDQNSVPDTPTEEPQATSRPMFARRAQDGNIQ